MIGEIHRATGHGIRRICEVLELPRSSYYHAAAPTPSKRSDKAAGDAIEEIFKSHRRRYGHRRIWHELAGRGITCAPARVRRLMAERGLKAIQPKTFVPKTSDGRADKPSPNLIAGKELPTGRTKSGRATSPSFPPPPDGFTSRWSSTSARAASPAGRWPATCAPGSLPMLSPKDSARVVRPRA